MHHVITGHTCVYILNVSVRVLQLLTGGGNCATYQDCQDRKASNLGSANASFYCDNLNDVDPVSDGALLSNHTLKNPFFHHAHKVYLPYLTGDAHLGMRTESYVDDNNGDWECYFSGALNFQHIIQHLKNNSGLDQATHILLTGSSAGGVGVFGLAEWLQDQFDPSTTVKAATTSGLFPHQALLNTTWPEYLNGTTHSLEPEGPIGTMEIWSALEPQSCLDALQNTSSYVLGLCGTCSMHYMNVYMIFFRLMYFFFGILP